MSNKPPINNKKNKILLKIIILNSKTLKLIKMNQKFKKINKINKQKILQIQILKLLNLKKANKMKSLNKIKMNRKLKKGAMRAKIRNIGRHLINLIVKMWELYPMIAQEK